MGEGLLTKVLKYCVTQRNGEKVESFGALSSIPPQIQSCLFYSLISKYLSLDVIEVYK